MVSLNVLRFLIQFLLICLTISTHLFQSISQKTAMNVRAWGDKFVASFAKDN